MPYGPSRPVLGMDGQPVQLQWETRIPRPVTLQHGKCVDDEYGRAGTACAFIFTEHVHRAIGRLA